MSEISSTIKFSELCSHCVFQKKYSLFAQGAKLGNFGKFQKSKKSIDYQKKKICNILPLV